MRTMRFCFRRTTIRTLENRDVGAARTRAEGVPRLSLILPRQACRLVVQGCVFSFGRSYVRFRAEHPISALKAQYYARV